MLKIFNSYTGKQENFIVHQDNMIKMYVCGMTVYDFCHIGHGRTVIFFDIVARYLRYLGYKLKYVRNITDIDDKIIKKSLVNKESCFSLSNRMIINMHRDFSLLNILSPDREPRVTECISDIIKKISILLAKKYAYVAYNGDIVFSVDSYSDYGMLSKQVLHQLKHFVRISSNKNVKQNPLDFVLWKAQKKSDFITWESPWGAGRPGWHIECSSMSILEFQDRIDIHGGGIDLLFPHHENELAQSVCINKNFFTRYWMHTGLVIINDKKMSKSLGNTILLKDLLFSFDSESIRYFLLSTHYRHPLNFCYQGLYRSRELLKKLYLSLRDTDSNAITNLVMNRDYKIDFLNALNNDFNTPVALSILVELSKKINKYKLIDKTKANFLAFILVELGNILGLLFQHPDSFLKNTFIGNIDILKVINSLIDRRTNARNRQDWQQSDKIRKELLEMGIILEDTYLGTIWRSLK